MNRSFKHQGRTIVLGIDGAPCSLLMRLAANGAMPALAGLLRSSIHGPMRSSIPPVSSAAWASFMTGLNPGGHGIYGFTRLAPGSYRLEFPVFTDIRAPVFWTRFNELGQRAVVINMPMTYPAPELDGLLVSGFVAPRLDKAVFPRDQAGILKKTGYRLDVDADLALRDKDAFLDDLLLTFDKRIECFRWAWKEIDWGLFVLTITETDRLNHFLYDAAESESHPRHEAFIGFYKKVDALIAEILENISEEDALYIVSDHGFCPSNTVFNINAWLEKTGFLSHDSRSDESMTLDINPGTRAFALDPCRIHLNRKGVCPLGSVMEDDASGILEEIAGALSDLCYEGRQVISRVYTRKDAYSGPYTRSGPDLTALPCAGFNIRASRDCPDIFVPDVFKGTHTYDDAFFLASHAAAVSVPPATIHEAGALIARSAKIKTNRTLP